MNSCLEIPGFNEKAKFKLLHNVVRVFRNLAQFVVSRAASNNDSLKKLVLHFVAGYKLLLSNGSLYVPLPAMKIFRKETRKDVTPANAVQKCLEQMTDHFAHRSLLVKNSQSSTKRSTQENVC